MAATEVIKRDDKFGLCDTYNPYTNSMSLANVANQRFRIPLNPTFANSSVVVVSTGLVPSIESVLNGDLIFNVYEEDNTTLIRQLTPRIVDIGSGQYPTDKEINWFNVVGMQGDFMVHSDYCGKILEMSGKIETCSITAEDINGINKSIQDNYNDLLDRINNAKTKWKTVAIDLSFNYQTNRYHPPTPFIDNRMAVLEHRFTGYIQTACNFTVVKSATLLTGRVTFSINVTHAYLVEKTSVNIPVGDSAYKMAKEHTEEPIWRHPPVYLQSNKPSLGICLNGEYNGGGIIGIDGLGTAFIRGLYIW